MSLLKAFIKDLKEISFSLKEKINKKEEPVGGIYRHHTGQCYKLLLIANEFSDRKDFIPTAVYKHIGTDIIYSRPLTEFKEKFTIIK